MSAKRVLCSWLGARRFSTLDASKHLRCAFIGAGDISTLHAEGIRNTQNVDLAGIWSRPNCEVVLDPGKVARGYGCRLYSKPEEICTDPTIDAVFVLTNMETHAKYSQMAMDNGKHVLCEKPVASTLQELEDMKACSERNNVVLMPGHNYIYEPWFYRTKDLLASGELGEITSCYILYNIKHPPAVTGRDSVQGVIRQILTHHAYCTLFLMGNPKVVSAFAANIDNGDVQKENLACVNMQMGNGGIAHMQANFSADDHGSDPWSFYVKLLGTKGSARYSYNDWVVNAKHIVHSHSYVPYPHTVREECRYFFNSVLRQKKKPLSTIDDAITCLKILEATETSIRENRHVFIA